MRWFLISAFFLGVAGSEDAQKANAPSTDVADNLPVMNALGEGEERKYDEEKLKKAFKEWDTDNDGSLGKKEFGSGLWADSSLEWRKIYDVTEDKNVTEQKTKSKKLWDRITKKRKNAEQIDFKTLSEFTEKAVMPGATKVSLKNPPKWAADDPVVVYYAEFLLSAWVLDHAPWNAYHSGLGFINERTGEHALFDYCPDDTSSTTKLIFPNIPVDLKSPWSIAKLLLGAIDVNWRNGAHMTLLVGKAWPKHFTNFVKLGNLNGAKFGKFATWVEQEFQGDVFTFDAYEVLVMDKNGSVKDQLGSNMCHDFVSNALWALYNDGIKLKPESMLFRDHIIVYGKTITKIDDMYSNWFHKRSMLRFYRTCLLYLEQIKKQFTFGRETLCSVWKLGIPAIVYTQQQYYQVELAPPFLNYCYLALAIPPEKHNPLTTNKLCALSVEANFTNSSLPVPYGLELGVEEQLDNPAVLISLGLIAMGAALPGLFRK